MSAPPSPGIYRDIPPERYHSWEAVSQSGLHQLLRSPAHLRAYLDQEPRETPAQILGRAVHAAVLEPQRFWEGYGLLPVGLDRRTKAGKEAWAALVEQHGEGNVLNPEDHQVCARVAEAVRQHRLAGRLVTGAGDVELSLAWEDEETHLPCKARWDRYSLAVPGGAIVDLKTARDASPGAFERAAFANGYHIQAAFYLAGARACRMPVHHYCIVAAEKEPPWALAVYRMTEAVVEAAQEQVRALLRRWRDCEELAEWPGYPEEVRDISLPTWGWDAMRSQTEQVEEETNV